jgi:hypothetical protein
LKNIFCFLTFFDRKICFFEKKKNCVYNQFLYYWFIFKLFKKNLFPELPKLGKQNKKQKQKQLEKKF